MTEIAPVTPDPSGVVSQPRPGFWHLRPRAFFVHLRQRPKWLGISVLLVAGHAIVSSLMFETSMQATLLRIPHTASSQDKSEIVTVVRQEHLVRTLLLPLRLGIGWALFAALLYGICRSFLPGGSLQFRQVMSLEVHAEFFNLVTRFTIVVRSIFYSSGDPVTDLVPPLSVAGLVSPDWNFISRLVFGLIEPFTAGYVLTLAVGISVFYEIRLSRAFFLAFLAWAFSMFLNITLVELLRTGLHLRLG
jgi:hypothetical protein